MACNCSSLRLIKTHYSQAYVTRLFSTLKCKKVKQYIYPDLHSTKKYILGFCCCCCYMFLLLLLLFFLPYFALLQYLVRRDNVTFKTVLLASESNKWVFCVIVYSVQKPKQRLKQRKIKHKEKGQSPLSLCVSKNAISTLNVNVKQI